MVPAMCTKQPLNNQDTACGPKGVRNREVPLYMRYQHYYHANLDSG